MNASQASPQEIASFLVSKSADRVLAVGPVVWVPTDVRSKCWYFVIGFADAAGDFHVDVIVGREDDRRALMIALVTHRPLVVHDFDDELVMARFCEAIWPCAKLTRIRQQIERERRA
jgi:hypothetical protein